MKLSEALRINQTATKSDAEKFTIFLACGFTPLHLETFLTALLRERLPKHKIQIQTGLFGDLSGNLKRFKKSSFQAGTVVIEWSDLDPRLGLRSLGGWGSNVLADIQESVKAAAERLFYLLEELAGATPLAICLPTLPLPPISYLPSSQFGLQELSLKKTIQELALKLAALFNVKLVNQQRLDESSPLSERINVKSELTAGFPYQTPHAFKVAELLAELIQPFPPKKGLITDLDDTLWHGLLGEDGVLGISWNLDNHSHINALYQQMLKALAESGVLIGVASKNDHSLALEALERTDLILPKKHLFPLEINWQQKSRSVAKILKAWNINADAVVFVDDSPIELAEVKAVYPEMECLLFPKNDVQTVYDLLKKLRGMFGKQAILEEDRIRAESLRRAVEFQDEARREPSQSLQAFLENLQAELSLDEVNSQDTRSFELINKTNQFNLNGKRLSNADFEAALRRRGAVSLAVSYKDKFGPLGKIAVLLGYADSSTLKIDTWVMSCRAFSRHIEYKCLEYLFENCGVSEIELTYQATDRNEPIRQFLRQLLDKEPDFPCIIGREIFMEKRPELLHSVVEMNRV